MKKILFLFLFLQLSLSAQTIEDIIEESKQNAKAEKVDSLRASIYCDLAWYYAQVSVDSALVYGHKAVNLAEAINHERLKGQAYNDLSTVYLVKGDYQKSLDYGNKSLAIRKKLNDQAGIASLHFKMGNNFNKLGLFDSTMHHYILALKYYEDQKDSVVIANLHGNIANTYYFMSNYDKALDYLDEPIKYFQRTADYGPLANSLVSLGNVQLALKDTTTALLTYEKAVAAAEKSNNQSTLAAIYNNYANIYTQRNEFDKAIDYIQKSIKIREDLGQYSDLESSKLTLALNQFKMGDYESAKPKLLKIKTAFEKIAAKEKLKEIYLFLSYVYAYEKKPDSVSFYNAKFNQINDELQEAVTLKNSQEIDVKYQTEKKEKEILLQRAKLAEQRLTIFIFIGLLAVSLIAGYLIYFQQKVKNVQLKKENELKDALLKIETQNKLQEQRLRISRDLHDNIGAQLTFVISSIDNLKFAFANQQPIIETKLTQISSFTRETINELRDTIWAMNKDNINIEDLKSRISNFIDNAKLSSNGIEFSFTYNKASLGETIFNSQSGMNIYRVIQEAINNAIKHAEATSIKVNIDAMAQHILVEIEDNGKGFKSEDTRDGNGLRSMKKRAEELKGELSISKQNQGTKISLSIPKTS